MSTSWFACENCQTPTIRWMVPNQNKKLYVQGAVNPKLPRLIGETLMKWLARAKLTEAEFDSLCFPIRLFDLFVLFHRAGFLSAASRRVKQFRSNRLKTIAGLRGIGKKMLKKCDGIPLCHVYWYYYSECILLAPAIPHEQLECYATPV